MNTEAHIGEKIFSPFIEPPEDWKDREDYIFLTFVLQFHKDHCTNCGAVNHWSNVFRAFGKRNVDKTNYRRLVPTETVPNQAPVMIFNMPTRSVPICHQCIKEDRKGAGMFLVSSEAAWNEAIRREREFRESTKNLSKPKAPIREDLDDIPI